MKRAWRLRATGGRYYAEYTTDDGDSWTSTPPGGFASATAAAQLVADMKRTDETEGAGLSEDERLALLEKFGNREDELADDMTTPEAKRAEAYEGWRKYCEEHGISEEGAA